MILSQSEEERRLTLYKKGYSDKEIANICDVSRRGISRWRQRRIFPSNGRLYLNKDKNREREILHEKGFSDRAIAKKLKLTKAAIQWWRKGRNKPPNFRHHYPINPKLEMSNTLSYILGVVYGDGYFVRDSGGSYRLGLKVKEKMFATSFMQALIELGLHPFLYYNNGWCVIAHSKVFYIAFSQPNFLELYDKLIENKNFAWSFLRGAYEAEGSIYLRSKGYSIGVEIFSNQNPRFFELVKNLCTFCHIPYTKIREDERKNGKIMRRLTFKGSTSEALSFLKELTPAIKNSAYALSLLQRRTPSRYKSVNSRYKSINLCTADGQ